jgi:hypothetical protein
MIFVFITGGYYLIKRNVKAIIYVIFFIFFYAFYGPRLLQVSFNKSNEETQALRLLSFNIGGFKQSNDPSMLPVKLKDFFGFLEQEQIDVVFFQEFSLVTKNISQEMFDLGYRDIMFENPLVSPLKIREKIFVKMDYFNEQVLLNEENEVMGVKTEILYGRDTITLINTHIQSFNVKSLHPFRQTSIIDAVKVTGAVLKNIGDNKAKQFKQINYLSELAQETSKVIFCGDFNSIPSTYNYTWLSNQFTNAFEKAGNGFGFTYLGKTLFFLRIDHQFYNNSNIDCIDFSEIDFELSDHRATYSLYKIGKTDSQ